MLYENSWASLNKRPVPQWFADAKFGIFIHWGLYSVPSFARKDRFAEWYKKHMMLDDGPEKAFHKRVYGNATYADFVKDFKAELFDADEWAELFARAGAKYMDLTSKHHDGFCMFHSPYAWHWNSVDVGPKIDFCAELKKAMDKVGVRFGVYHSLYEWDHPLYQKDPEEFAVKHLIPMLKDLICRYEPATLFTDGEWDHPSSVWHAEDFLAWLYNESPVKDYIVPNDRWGKETRGRLGGNFTTEYGHIGNENLTIDEVHDERPFEECRGIGRSFGLNRAENAEDYMTSFELLSLFVDLVSAGGNLLLNVGPAADGTIPPIQQERLLQMGRWLSVNGEAIYGSRKYTNCKESDVKYTKKGDTVYAFVKRFPFGKIVLDKVPFNGALTASLLGSDAPIATADENGSLALLPPALNPDTVASKEIYVFKLEKAAK